MNRALTVLTCLLGLSLIACQPEQDMSAESAEERVSSEVAATPTPQVAQTTTQASLLSEPNWAILFAGHDLSSFNIVGDAEWNIVDDYVEASGDFRSYLVTKGYYTDFLLQAEFWPSTGTNSGIFIRNESPDEINATGGYEINIRDINEENPQNQTGSIVNHVPPSTNILTEEKWNNYEIRAEGNRIVAQVNGVITADAELNAHQSGPIAFQLNGGHIRFRNIRIRPL
ncbi:MAG: DUF1080 domain-containing protein [Gammaproteobacteria bacterium]|nr:DUF1080 domain-containing protein [Gammaproteobacteria bacterium]